MDETAEEKLEIRDLRGGKWGWFPKQIVVDSRLQLSSKMVYMVFALLANTRQEAWPSREMIGKNCVLSVRSVTYAIQELERCGYVRVYRENGKRSKYILLEPSETTAKFAPVQSKTKTTAEFDTKPLQPQNHDQDIYRDLEKDDSSNVKKPNPKVLEKTRKDLVKKGVIPR